MGRDKRNETKEERWTKLVRPMMDTPAWRSLSSTAQALYPWVRMEWRGPKANNNGRLSLSVRQAADALGVNPKTAARAFQDLQAKGFLVCTKGAVLGTQGHAKSPEFELTEIGLPTATNGRRLYLEWSQGGDFPVTSTPVHNPFGANGKNKTLSPKLGRGRPQKWNENNSAVPKTGTGRPQNWDEMADFDAPAVPKSGTTLSTRYTANEASTVIASIAERKALTRTANQKAGTQEGAGQEVEPFTAKTLGGARPETIATLARLGVAND